jgi:protein transport protein SEC13
MSNPIVPITQIETLHEDMVHDCQFDYYSKKLATCSSDRTIKIFDVTGDIYHCSANLNNVHDGPVWQVAWAHPKFGVILASCSYDGSVVIQREQSQANWIRLYEHKVPDASVNSIAWAPHEFGLILACAASDGKIYIIEYKNASWYLSNNFYRFST